MAPVAVPTWLTGTAFWIEGDGYTANGCTVTTHVDIPIVPTPDATITAPDTVCEWNDYVASVADAGPGAVYDWHIGSAEITSGAGTSRIHFTPYIINPSNPNVGLSVDITTAAARFMWP